MRRECPRVDFTCGAQTLQPGGQELVHFLLGKQFFDSWCDFGQRNVGRAGLAKLGQKLVIVVTLDALEIDIDGGAQTAIHQTQQVALHSHVVLDAVLG